MPGTIKFQGLKIISKFSAGKLYFGISFVRSFCHITDFLQIKQFSLIIEMFFHGFL